MDMRVCRQSHGRVVGLRASGERVEGMEKRWERG
jgi:hypothetical protein